MVLCAAVVWKLVYGGCREPSRSTEFEALTNTKGPLGRHSFTFLNSGWLCTTEEMGIKCHPINYDKHNICWLPSNRSMRTVINIVANQPSPILQALVSLVGSQHNMSPHTENELALVSSGPSTWFTWTPRSATSLSAKIPATPKPTHALVRASGDTYTSTSKLLTPLLLLGWMPLR